MRLSGNVRHRAAALLKKLADDLSTRLQAIPGALVEDKQLAITVHYRMVDPALREDVRRLIHATLASAEYPFCLTTGDKVYEIRPRGDWNKGTAVSWVRDQLAQPDALDFFIGDDTSDEDAFAALPDGITIKVGKSAETRARYWVDNPARVLEFLTWLARRMSARAPDCAAPA